MHKLIIEYRDGNVSMIPFDNSLECIAVFHKLAEAKTARKQNIHKLYAYNGNILNRCIHF